MENMKQIKIDELMIISDELVRILALALDPANQDLFIVETCIVLNKDPNALKEKDVMFVYALILQKIQDIDDQIEQIEKIGAMKTGKGRNKK